MIFGFVTVINTSTNILLVIMGKSADLEVKRAFKLVQQADSFNNKQVKFVLIEKLIY